MLQDPFEDLHIREESPASEASAGLLDDAAVFGPLADHNSAERVSNAPDLV